MTQDTNPAGGAPEPDNVTRLPDGSAFVIASFPLPDSHWLYAPREYAEGADEPKELPRPILNHAEHREAVVAAIRCAVRGATMCGKEPDFDPDALVQNAVYALCGPFGGRTTLAEKIALASAPAQSGLKDAYVGAREDLSIWKRRALEAEATVRNFVREANSPTFMGDPASDECHHGDAFQGATKMTNTTTTSGAADLPEALRLAAAISNLLCSNEAAARTLAAAADELVRLHAESEMRRAALLDEMQKAALAAGQATAAQPGAAYAALPDEGEPWRGHKFKEVQRGCWRCDCGKTIKEVTSDQSTPASGGNYPVMPKRYTVDDDGEELFTVEKMRAFADATCAMRASHGQAPAQPDPAYSEACNLATALFKKHFAHLPDFASGQAVWGLCASTAGVISQIDNMVSGLVQPPTPSPQADNKKKDPL